jgi:hypothetical protein
MRINQGDTASILYVLEYQIPKQRGFSSAGLPDHIDVLAAGGNVNAEGVIATPLVPMPDENVIILFHPSRPLFREGHSPRGP